MYTEVREARAYHSINFIVHTTPQPPRNVIPGRGDSRYLKLFLLLYYFATRGIKSFTKTSRCSPSSVSDAVHEMNRKTGTIIDQYTIYIVWGRTLLSGAKKLQLNLKY